MRRLWCGTPGVFDGRARRGGPPPAQGSGRSTPPPTPTRTRAAAGRARSERRARPAMPRLFPGRATMADDVPRPPFLAVRVVYEDLPDLIEIETRAVAGMWSGAAGAYTSPESLRESARELH